MAVWSERHVMQLDKRLLKLARTPWLIVSSMSAGPQKILNGPGNIKCLFLSSEHVLSLKSKCRCSFDGFILSFDRTEEQTTHTGSSSPSVSLLVKPNFRSLFEYLRVFSSLRFWVLRHVGIL